MKITQQLSTGITVRQNFKDCVRFVMFETGVEGWEYATHGGTVFIVNLQGKLFGLTCRHVFGDFNWRQIRITEAKFGRQFARLKSLVYPTQPRGEAIGTDILDVAVIEFADDVGADFFADSPYLVDANTVGTSNEGDVLFVNGALKEMSDLSEPAIAPVFCLLEFHDYGATSADPSLREAYAEFAEPRFRTITGMSGSPVYNATRKQLCGMVVRGVLTGAACKLWYIDIFDVVQFLSAIVESRSETDYTKTLVRGTLVPDF
jgi:hypothetical protein